MVAIRITQKGCSNSDNKFEFGATYDKLVIEPVTLMRSASAISLTPAGLMFSEAASKDPKT